MKVAYGADTECRLSTDVLHRESACSGVTSRAFFGQTIREQREGHVVSA